MNKDNLSIKNLQKVDGTKIEDSHPYIAELVKIIKNIGFQEMFLDNFYWGVGFLLCEKIEQQKNKNSIKISIKRYIAPIILITLVAYIAIGHAV